MSGNHGPNGNGPSSVDQKEIETIPFETHCNSSTSSLFRKIFNEKWPYLLGSDFFGGKTVTLQQERTVRLIVTLGTSDKGGTLL